MTEEYKNAIKLQEERLQKVGKIQEETQFLNEQLDKCIDLVSSSVVNEDSREQFDFMKSENRKLCSLSNDALDCDLNGIKNNLSEIRENDNQEKKEDE